MIETLATLITSAGYELPPVPERLSQATPYGPDDDFWYGPAVHGGISGIRVSQEGALQCVAFWACVNVIATTLATLPFSVYKRLKNGGKEPATDHEVYFLIHDQPNGEVTSVEFWETALTHILTTGNAFARIITDQANRVQSLELLDPRLMVVKRDKQTRVKYYEYQQDGETKVYFDDEILHIPGLGFDGLIGYSPVQQHRRTIELAMAQEEWQLRFLSNNARPGMYIKHPGTLSDKAKKNLIDSWNAVHQGLNGAGKTGVLEEGMEVVTVGSPAKDIEFLGQLKFQLEQVARIFRVPLHLIQMLDKATNNNIEHQSIDFVMHTIRPWARRIEARVNRSLFGPREQASFFAEFNLEGLLRGDSTARAQFYATMRNAGIMTANEIRVKENLNPVAGGDDLLVQGAMIPISQVGQQQEVANAA